MKLHAVDLQEQYVFIHDAILESLTCGDTEVNSANMRVAMKKLNQLDPKVNMTRLQTQFKVNHMLSRRCRSLTL